MQQILYHKPTTWLACVGGAYANTAQRWVGVTSEATWFSLRSQSQALSEGVAGASEQVCLGCVLPLPLSR